MTRIELAKAPSREGDWTGLDVRQLRALVALVDQGSMSAAAPVLGVAQSTVSEALAALERALGTPVIARKRGAHALALTTAGRALLPHARAVLASIEEAHAAVAATSREVRASVHIATNESISTYLLPRVLGAMRRKWLRTSFAVTVGTCHSVREGLAKGGFDLGFLLQAEAGAPRSSASPPESAPRVVSLTEVRLLLFARSQHPLQARATVPRDLLEPYMVFMSDASGDFHALVSDFLRADDMPGPRLEATGSNEGVKRSVMTDPLALGVLPEYALAEELRAGLVRSVPVSPALPSVRLEAVLPGGARSHPAVLELLEACREAVAMPATGGRGAAQGPGGGREAGPALRGVEGPGRRRTR